MSVVPQLGCSTTGLAFERQTSPMPPTPILAVTSYAPRRVPGLRGMALLGCIREGIDYISGYGRALQTRAERDPPYGVDRLLLQGRRVGPHPASEDLTGRCLSSNRGNGCGGRTARMIQISRPRSAANSRAALYASLLVLYGLIGKSFPADTSQPVTRWLPETSICSQMITSSSAGSMGTAGVSVIDSQALRPVDLEEWPGPDVKKWKPKPPQEWSRLH